VIDSCFDQTWFNIPTVTPQVLSPNAFVVKCFRSITQKERGRDCCYCQCQHKADKANEKVEEGSKSH
jgi:hypothetical protein